MSAQPLPPPAAEPSLALAPMRLADVGAVAAIEKSIYTAPWTEGNFVDSLTAGYSAWVLRRADPSLGADRLYREPIVGYFVLMPAVDEAHLLNLSVARDGQGQGLGLHLLRRAVALANEYNARSIILEVRPSNLRALAVYQRFGFREHGRRRRYYPASAEDQTSREDALVMRLPLA